MTCSLMESGIYCYSLFVQIKPQIANSGHLTSQLGKTDSDNPQTGANHQTYTIPKLHQP